jgi:hypothetical protein
MCIEEAVAHASKNDMATMRAMDLFAVWFGCYDPATSRRLFLDYGDAARSGLPVDVVAGLVWRMSRMETGWQPGQPLLFSVNLPPELAAVFPNDLVAWGLQRDWQATVLLCESAYLALYEENQQHVAWVVHVLTGRHLVKGATMRAFWLALFKARERGWRSIAKPAAYVKAVAWRERPWLVDAAWLVGRNGRRGSRATATELKTVIERMRWAYDQVVRELEGWPEVVVRLLEQLGDERHVESRVHEVLNHAVRALAERLDALGRLELDGGSAPLYQWEPIDEGACCQISAGGVHHPHCQRRVYSTPERECPAALRFDRGRSARPLKGKRQPRAVEDPDEQFVYRTLKPKGEGHRESQNFVRLHRVQGLPETLDPDVERVLEAKSGGIKYGLPEYLSETTGEVWTARRVDATRQRIARMRRCIKVETIEVPNVRMYGELAAGGWHIEDPRVIRKAAGEPRSSPTFIRERIYDLAMRYPHAPWIAKDRDSRETFSLVYAHAPWILANPEFFGLQFSIRLSTDFVFDRSTGFPGGRAGSQPVARPKKSPG